MRPPETLSTTPTTTSIAIIGAGPAGLTLATALAERDLDAPEIGDRVRRHVGASGQR